jgi:hypothetical protein
MDTLRFGMTAVALFVLAFVGISWASRGFPIAMIKVAPLKPDARGPMFQESVNKGARQEEESQPSQSDGHKGRDKLRLELLQAANAYTLSPCDQMIRRNLIGAMTNYTMAWATIAGCRKDGVCTWEDKKLDAAREAFYTPADKRVHVALREAVWKGGINRDDFPPMIRESVMQWSGLPFAEPEACHAHRREADTRLR